MDKRWTFGMRKKRSKMEKQTDGSKWSDGARRWREQGGGGGRGVESWEKMRREQVFSPVVPAASADCLGRPLRKGKGFECIFKCLSASLSLFPMSLRGGKERTRGERASAVNQHHKGAI